MRVIHGPEVFVQRRGGISRYHIELHKGLLQRGHSSLILAGWHHSEALHGVSRVIGVRADGERYRATINETLLRAAAASIGRGGIVHKTYYSRPSAEWRNHCVVVTVHDLIYAKFPHYFPHNDSTAAWQQWWAERADVVLVPSETTADDVRGRFAVDPQRVFVTPLGVRTPDRVDESPAPRRPFLLYVGLRSGYKHWDLAITALKRLGRERPLLVCVGGGAFDADERRFLAGAGLVDDVLHLPAPSDASLFGLYRRALGLVHTSEYEGFGLPILEAMSQGCPVVAVAGGAVAEVAGDSALLVSVNDVDGLVDALARVVEDKRLRADLAQAGRARSAAFSWSRTVELTEAAYAVALAR